MEIIRIPRVMQETSRGHLLHGRTVGLVPTMGALHEGHLSLVRMAREENAVAVVSIYINPVQFGPSEDLSKYPRDLEGDMEKLKREDVDVLFLPDDALMYPRGFSTYVDVRGLSERLCGAYRPGHFRGVATVVTKLLNIVSPIRTYFGQKDFQQTVIIRRLVKDLDMGTEIVVCPSLREENGLAMSSRNSYLTRKERNAASVIYRSLLQGSEAVKSGIIEVEVLKKLMMEQLTSEQVISEVQYCSVYSTETLDEIERIEGEALLALAVRIGNTRLIDNMLVTPGR
ncbi:MAG TPA: pantoate--beta-alanine ligase [Thermodesulfovibrionales bacterium]|jgi:pantoate--beta-alanine ligase|nr:pantoate--beta-alanine ligase [Thermodesulfovibrionales bacterium]